VLAEHYGGDDTNVRTLLGGVLVAFAGITVDDFEGQSDTFLRTMQHPTPRSPLSEMRVRPDDRAARLPRGQRVLELHRLRRRRDFMPPVTHEVFGIPREHVIGSATALEYITDERGGAIIRRPEADYLDDGPQQPIRIWSHAGRRPLLAAGNSNGDIPMLDFTRHRGKPFLPLLVLHDDAEREFDYTAGAEQALERADATAWTVISIKSDWAAVFPA
jgi:hypothetical protein